LWSVRVATIAMETQKKLPFLLFFGVDVALRNTRAFSVAMEMRRLVRFVLLTIFHTAVKSAKYDECMFVFLP
jgi:hypothetical protein